MKNIILIITCLSVSTSFIANAQEEFHFVRFIDKKETQYSIKQPEKFLSQRAIARRKKQNIAIDELDLPVSDTYIKNLKNLGAKIYYQSKWFNGVLIKCTTDQYTNITKESFVRKAVFPYIIENSSKNGNRLASYPKFNKIADTQSDKRYGNSYNFINIISADDLHKENIKGQGKLIAVLDNGFIDVNKSKFFKHLIEQDKILDTFDFYQNQAEIYSAKGSHGLSVLSVMGAYSKDEFVGVAPEASYALYITEVTAIESRLEEYFWTFAAERADSLGADVINSSLGYSTFDNSKENYKFDHLNGDISVITQAADWAASKGIVVVNSAGNKSIFRRWKKITAPADADSILSVGSVNIHGTISTFSAEGPTADKRIKPEVFALGELSAIDVNDVIKGTKGTSFASPGIAGLAALLWQKYPNLTAQGVIAKIKSEGSNAKNIKSEISSAQNVNEKFGYGIPFFRKLTVTGLPLLNNTNTIQFYPNPTSDNIYWDTTRNFFLYSLLGVELAKGRGKKANLSSLPSATYRLCVDNQCSFIVKE